MKCIRLLEDHFHYGVCCDKTNDLSIRDAITLSTIVMFSTSEEGWKNVANGNIVFRANGPKTEDSHSSIIEGYDLEHDTYICKNSWGGKTAKPRFELSKTGPHKCKFCRVYFTLDSIRGKTNKMFQPKMEKFIGQLNGKKINCAWMDLITATYCSEYLCEYHDEKEGPLKYLGYDVDQWIKLNLQRSHKYSLFDYYNNPDLEL